MKNKQAKDIFDLSNLDDLPDGVKKHLRLLNFRKHSYIIAKLFEEQNCLTLDQVIVALYRKHKIIKDRKAAICALYYLQKRNFLNKLKDGSFVKVNSVTV